LAYIGNKPANKAVVASDLDPAVITGQTALAVAPADTDEFLISDAGTLKRLDASLIGGDNTPSFFVTLSGDQSIGNESWTKITFDTETWDTDSAFASNKFTVPSGEGGKYYIAAKTALADIDDNELAAISIYKNGSQIGTTQFEDRSSGTNKAQFLVVNTILDLSASDYLEVYAFHAEGGSINALSSRSYFGGYKLIGV
jgi:hypothetical protein